MLHKLSFARDFYEAQHRKLQIKYLKSKAAKLGFQIIEAPAA